MLILGYCPKCEYVFSDKKKKQMWMILAILVAGFVDLATG